MMTKVRREFPFLEQHLTSARLSLWGFMHLFWCQNAIRRNRRTYRDHLLSPKFFFLDLSLNLCSRLQEHNREIRRWCATCVRGSISVYKILSWLEAIQKSSKDDIRVGSLEKSTRWDFAVEVDYRTKCPSPVWTRQNRCVLFGSLLSTNSLCISLVEILIYVFTLPQHTLVRNGNGS